MTRQLASMTPLLKKEGKVMINNMLSLVVDFLRQPRRSTVSYLNKEFTTLFVAEKCNYNVITSYYAIKFHVTPNNHLKISG